MTRLTVDIARVEAKALLADLLLTNAKIYTRNEVVKAGLAVEGGRICKVAKEANLPKAVVKLDLEGNLVLPGLIDSHVHLRNQQLTYKEDFLSGTSAAAAGGVTLAIDMPNNKPVTMSQEALKNRMRLAETKAVVNVAFFSAFPEDLREARLIVDEGAVGFKLYLSQSVGGLDILDDKMLLQGLKKAQELKVPVAVHAEDAAVLEDTRRKIEGAGRKDVGAYLEVHSTRAEDRATRRIVGLCEQSSAHVHVCHVSSAVALNVILDAKTSSLPVTCEVTPHHLFLSSKDLQDHGPLALTDPPLRTGEDGMVLRNALKNGSIDFVASDHAPHRMAEKKLESVWSVKPGVPGLETTLPLLLTEVNEGRLAISDLVRVTSERPANVFDLKDRGSMKEGSWADLVVVDLGREYKIDVAKFHSKAKYSPFDGRQVKGSPVKTFVSGRLVMNEGEIVAEPGAGQIVRPVTSGS